LRVRRLEAYETDNTTGKPFYIYCNSNKLKSKNLISVTYQYNVWFKVGEREGHPILGELFLKICEFDLPDQRYDQDPAPMPVETTRPSQDLPEVDKPEATSSKESDSKKEDRQTNINVQIRNSPVHEAAPLVPTTIRFLGIPSPTMHAQQTTMSTTTMQTALGKITGWATRTGHRYGLPQVRVRVQIFPPARNPYPQGGLGGFGRVFFFVTESRHPPPPPPPTLAAKKSQCGQLQVAIQAMQSIPFFYGSGLLSLCCP
jgi:hypothetical protein